MMTPNKNMLFSFNTKVLEDLYVDCGDQAAISENLLKDFFNKNETNKYLLSILCESYSLNYKLKGQLEEWFDSMPIAIIEDKEVITVEAPEAMFLEASIFAREEIKADLRKKFNISSHYN